MTPSPMSSVSESALTSSLSIGVTDLPLMIEQTLGEFFDAQGWMHWIAIKPGQTLSEEEVKAFCKVQIAHYKVPRHIRFVDGFPMTVTGKIQKFKIREEMKLQLGLQETQTA